MPLSTAHSSQPLGSCVGYDQAWKPNRSCFAPFGPSVTISEPSRYCTHRGLGSGRKAAWSFAISFVNVSVEPFQISRP